MPLNQELLTRIKNNSFKEQTLSLNEEELTDKDIISLVEVLKHNHYIKQLELEANFISSLGAQSLAILPTLESLDVSANNIGSEGAIALAKSSLKKLNIAGNPIGEGIAAFAASPLLIELDVAACSNITNAGIEQLFSSKSIKKLNLSESRLSKKFSGECLKGLISNNILEELNFSSNNIGGRYCSYIAQSKTLKWLDFTNNFIGDEGAILLAQNDSLKKLFLTRCFIEDEGALALSQNAYLEVLSLYGNRITETAASAFALNTTLTYLNLEYNPFNPLNLIDLERNYKKDGEKTYVRTTEDIEMLLKKRMQSKFDYY